MGKTHLMIIIYRFVKLSPPLLFPIFVWCCQKGFKESPVDYYQRQTVIASQRDKLMRGNDFNCAGDIPEVTQIHDYWLQMARTFGKDRTTPFFAYSADFADSFIIALLFYPEKHTMGALKPARLTSSLFSHHGLNGNTQTDQHSENKPKSSLNSFRYLRDSPRSSILQGRRKNRRQTVGTRYQFI
ncbi:hypothetical protein PoB_005041500 [Plakobranchus ocellatus]|uniref:Uncharacterized protein n=1 Tax=Plakobranchus ocellatus TaxID=259542 RepID=A0AAV4BXM4_9GAST|nr:hypothetical protein PoB_005041500 [Plakobranchus ocellatus]